MTSYSKKIFYRLVITGIALTMLSGCGGTWSHACKNESSFYADKNACQIQSNQAYPPLMSSSNTSCYGYGNSMNCNSNSYDMNVFARSTFWDECMKSKSWVFNPN